METDLGQVLRQNFRPENVNGNVRWKRFWVKQLPFLKVVSNRDFPWLCSFTGGYFLGNSFRTILICKQFDGPFSSWSADHIQFDLLRGSILCNETFTVVYRSFNSNWSTDVYFPKRFIQWKNVRRKMLWLFLLAPENVQYRLFRAARLCHFEAHPETVQIRMCCTGEKDRTTINRVIGRFIPMVIPLVKGWVPVVSGGCCFAV